MTTLTTRLVASAALIATLTAAVHAQPTPPVTGPRSVQMFQGGTQNAWIAVNPPTTFVSGAAIPTNTPVQIRVYRSFDGGLTYPTRVQVVSGGKGRVGQGAFGSKTKPWIDAKLKVGVDNRAPHLVYLAVTAVVGGVESAPVNTNLTFRYWPAFQSYATPAAAAAANGAATPAGLAGTWTVNTGGTLTVRHKGKRFTATMSGPYDGSTITVTMTGSVQNTSNGVVYRFKQETSMSSMPNRVLKGDGQMTVRNGRVKGFMTMKFNGRSYKQKMDFRLDGRTLVDLTVKR